MKIKLLLAIIGSSFLFQGCDEQLEIPQFDSITDDNLYDSPAGASAGLTGAYSRVVAVYREAIINAQYPTNFTDEGHYNRNGVKNILKNNFTAANPVLTDIWMRYYEGVAATNKLLLGLQNGTLDVATKQEFRAEGLFLRAFLYFDIQKSFGGMEGIPMPLEETNSQLLPRTSGAAVYHQIIKDLKEAEAILPSAADAIPGRANKSAARGLIAKAYMYLATAPFNEVGAYEASRDWSKMILDDPYHILNESYEDVFNQLAMGAYETQETLFQIGFSFAQLDADQSSKLGSAFGMKMDDETCGGKGFALTYADISLIQKYRADPSDERGFWNTYPYFNRRNNNCELSTINNQFMYPASKWRRALEPNNTNTSYGSHHWPILRYADILLLYAEAENALNPNSSLALDAVNSVRERAKATPIVAITLEAIQEERLLELCFEGQRKYDLVRWGILADRVAETKANIEILAALPNFINDDWTSYGEPNLGADGIPESGDEPAVREIKKNALNASFNYYDGFNDFDATKHYILPIPEQELGVNTNLRQTTGW